MGKGAAPLLEDEMSGVGDGPENCRDLGSQGREEHPWGDPGSRETSGSGPGRVGLIFGLFTDPSPPVPTIPGVFHTPEEF